MSHRRSWRYRWQRVMYRVESFFSGCWKVVRVIGAVVLFIFLCLLPSIAIINNRLNPEPTRTRVPTRTPIPTRTPRPTYTPTPRPQPATLLEAIDKEWIEANVRGKDLSRVELEIESNIDLDLEIEIEAGTIFEAQSAGLQNMVVRKTHYVLVKPQLSISIELDVACANMRRDMPTGSDTLTVSTTEIPKDLVALFKLLHFKKESFRIQQFAIWTITDNPWRNDFVGISSTGYGGRPTDEEIEKIRQLFIDAGIDTAKYRALQ